MTLRLLCLALFSFSAFAADTNNFLRNWFAAQPALKTWSADFTQTRVLKTLQQPLRSEGRLVFSAPNNFRWQLGDPALTIAVRNSNEMTVIYPKLKRAERYPLDGAGDEPWREALALMDAGFPSDQTDFEKRFRLASVYYKDDIAELRMEPRNLMARKFMSEIRLYVSLVDFSMVANQLTFSDGSTLRNDFKNMVRNPEIPKDAFHSEVPSDFTVVQPTKK